MRTLYVVENGIMHKITVKILFPDKVKEDYFETLSGILSLRDKGFIKIFYWDVRDEIKEKAIGTKMTETTANNISPEFLSTIGLKSDNTYNLTVEIIFIVEKKRVKIEAVKSKVMRIVTTCFITPIKNGVRYGSNSASGILNPKDNFDAELISKHLVDMATKGFEPKVRSYIWKEFHATKDKLIKRYFSNIPKLHEGE